MWVPLGVKYHIPIDIFYKLNPKKMLRYQPYLSEWLKQSKHEENETGWVNGIYVAKAVSAAVFPKQAKYPEEVINLFGSSQSGSSDEEAYVLTDADRFAGFAIQFNKSNESRFNRKPTIDADVISVDGQDVAKTAEGPDE